MKIQINFKIRIKNKYLYDRTFDNRNYILKIKSLKTLFYIYLVSSILIGCNNLKTQNKLMNSKKFNLLNLDREITDSDILNNLSNSARINEYYTENLFEILQLKLTNNKQLNKRISLAKKNAFLLIYNSGKKFNYRIINNLILPNAINFGFIEADFAIFNNLNFNNQNLLNRKFILSNSKINTNPRSFANNGELIITSLSNICRNRDNKYDLELYNINSQKKIKSFKIFNNNTRIKEIKFFPNRNKILLSYEFDNIYGLGIFDFNKQKLTEIIRAKNKVFTDIKLSLDGSKIFYKQRNRLNPKTFHMNGKTSVNKPKIIKNVNCKSQDIISYNLINKRFTNFTTENSFHTYDISDKLIVAAGHNLILFENKNNFKNGIEKNKNGMNYHNLLSKKIIKNLYKNRVSKIIFSQDGKNIYTATQNHLFKKITIDTENMDVNINDIQFLNKPYLFNLKYFCLSHDGEILITLSSTKNNKYEYNRIRFWDLEKQFLFDFYDSYDNIQSLHLCSNSNKVLFYTMSNQISEIDINLKNRKNIEYYDEPYNSVLFFINNNYLATKSKGGKIYVWDIDSEKVIKIIYDKEDKIERLKPFSNMKKILLKDFDNFKIDNDNEEKGEDIKEESIAYSHLTPEVLFFKTKVSDFNGYENSFGYDHTPSFKEEKDEFSVIKTNDINYNCENYMNNFNEKILYVEGIKNESVVIMNISDGIVEIKYTLSTLPRNGLSKVAISNDKNKIALVYNNEIYLVDANENKQLGYIKGHRHNITNIKFSPNDSFLISTSGKNNCKLWNLKKNNHKQYFQNKKKKHGIINDFCISENNKVIITVGCENSIVITNLINNKTVQILNFADEIYKVAFSADHRYIATSGFGNIRIWSTTYENALSYILLKKNISEDIINELLQYINYENVLRYGILLTKTIGPKMMYIDNCKFKNATGICEITQEIFQKRGAKFV
ncbi:MAG: WD40 repeat domain-containing protein [Bacteroidetes bacterium]|nr:WD40 repeat domain-containing protein [Bacteroidota bacterium]